MGAFAIPHSPIPHSGGRMAKSNYVMAVDPATDLAILEALNAELEDYTTGSDLYRTVRVQTPEGAQMIQMSGGDVLTRIFRLAAEAGRLTPEQQRRFATVRAAAEKTIYSLRTRFHALLNREVKARLDALNWFLDDAVTDPKRARSEYPFEIRNRQRVEVIAQELGNDLAPELKQQLRRIDDRIRIVAQPTGFIWDSQLEPIFPHSPFWYLYVNP
jgi:hypothetical protein